MLDFDDIDAEAEKRIEAGEDVVGYVSVNNQAARGLVLPAIKRGRRLPDDTYLPSMITRHLPPANGYPVKTRDPVIRLLCCYGAGDMVAQDWAEWHHDVPRSVEMVTYEIPGHGIREDEPPLHTVDDVVDDAFLAFKEAMDTGIFAIVGHSIGAIIMTGVCRKARAELNVEPEFVFILERGPPNMAVLSQPAIDLLKSDIEGFLGLWAPMILKAASTMKGRPGEIARQKWQNDMQLERDIREVGWHIFKCPIYAFCATDLESEKLGGSYMLVEEVDPEDKEKALMKDLAVNMVKLRSQTPPRFRREIKTGSKTFMGHFEHDEFLEWSKWTDHPEGLTVFDCPGADHFTVKVHPLMREKVYEKLGEIAKRII